VKLHDGVLMEFASAVNAVRLMSGVQCKIDAPLPSSGSRSAKDVPGIRTDGVDEAWGSSREHHPKDAAEPIERQLGLPIFLTAVAMFALTLVLVILR
jgi:hypothetical protein